MATTDAPASTSTSVAYEHALAVIGAAEPTVAEAMRAELADQRDSLKLIASENYASPAVLLTMGSWLERQVRRGHRRPPVLRRVRAHRHHRVARRRPRQGPLRRTPRLRPAALGHRRQPRRLLGHPRPPHRGTGASAAAGVRHVNDLDDDGWAALRRALGDQRALGMSLDAGGHLTHGFRPNISGKMFDQRSYGTDPTDRSDRLRRPAGPGPRGPPARADRRLLAPTPAGSTSPPCATSPTTSAPRCSSTWPTSPAWSRARCSPATRTRCRSPTSRPPPPTSRCAGRAAGWSCASPSTPTPSTGAAPWSSAVPWAT